MAAIDSLPSWIELPPISSPKPPTTSLADELPIHELDWRDFERLCLRLARTQTDIIGARLYGTAGQAQEGIDLYARLNNSSEYRVYQCKRVEEFSPAIIRDAVSVFLRGTWAKRAKSIVLCTTDLLRTTHRVEEVERQTVRLAKKKIELDIWDREEISILLRERPRIVFEFFGSAWVEKVCGHDALVELRSQRFVLGPGEIATLRGRLLQLYRNIFATQDPGLVIAQQDTSLSLYERYIIPDVSVIQEWAGQTGSIPELQPVEAQQLTPSTDADLFTAPFDRLQRHRRRLPEVKGDHRRTEIRTRRSSFEHFFSAGDSGRFVILAGPGGGKSAFLRFLALDLLESEPRLGDVARMWGRHVPVWIPFGAWVEQTEKAGRVVPLSEMMHYWLRLFDETAIWPLFEQALSDQRLLLLVDGLDEWTSEGSARIALSQLNVFAAQRGTPVILTSRPHGFQQMAAEFPLWRIAEIAPLTRTQQTELAKIWFGRWLASDTRNNKTGPEWLSLEEISAQMASEFVEDISRLPDLEDLAGVPLLLSVLILLRYQHATLPDDRFSAYRALSEQLISIWPRKRRAAALIGPVLGFHLTDAERDQAYACLAYRIHDEFPSGGISYGEGKRCLEEFLHDEVAGLGFPDSDAKRGARDLMQVAESVSGILVERSPGQLGFYHRALQEFLTAQHIVTLPFEEQLKIVKDRVSDVLWREVILALLWLTRSNMAVSAIVSEVRAVAASARLPEIFHLRELLTEIAIGPFACPPGLSRELAKEAIETVSTCWWPPHQERVLHILLGGLRTRRLRSLLLPQIRRWYPDRTPSRVALLEEIVSWADHTLVQSILIHNLLNDDSVATQLASARILSERMRVDSLRELLLKLAFLPFEMKARSAILLALVSGWPAETAVREALMVPGNELVPEIYFLQLQCRMFDGDLGKDVATSAMELLRKVNYNWVDLVRETVLHYFSGDLYIRDLCLAQISQDSPRISALDAFWSILVEGYPNDDKVVTALVDELRHDQAFRFVRLNWSGLSTNFRDDLRLVKALDEWMLRERDEGNLQFLINAALVGRTESAKRILIEGLHGNYSHWFAVTLLTGWGMEDPDVADELLAIAMGSAERSARIAHLLPSIMDDENHTYERLLELLNDSSAKRTDFILSGLSELGRIADNQEVVDAVVRRAALGESAYDWGMVSQTIIDAPDMVGVRELAFAQLGLKHGAHAAAITSFGSDPTFMPRVLELLTPLPASLRLMIAEHIRDLRGADAELTEITREYFWDSDTEVSTSGSVAYFRRRRGDGVLEEDLHPIIERLGAVGPLAARAQQPAFAALVEMRRLHTAVLDSSSVFSRNFVMPLDDYIDVNYALIEVLLENWSYLSDVFEGDVLSHFVGGHFNNPENSGVFWDWVAPRADEYPIPTSLLLEYCDRTPSPDVGPNVLLFLARHRPGTLLLRDLCLKAFDNVTALFETPQLWEISADILVRQFPEDMDVWEAFSSVLSANMNNVLKSSAVVALGRAQPQSSQLFDFRAALHSDDFARMRPPVFFRLICATESADSLRAYVLRILQDPLLDELRYLPLLFHPLVERLQRDPALAARLARDRLDPKLPQIVKVGLTSVLRAIPGFVSEETLRKELLQASSSSSEVEHRAVAGFNLRSGRVVPLSHIILERLERAFPIKQ